MESARALIGWGLPIAILRTELHAGDVLAVDSGSFRDHGPIPTRCSALGEGRSPSLCWSAKAGAQSYLLLVEDSQAQDTGLGPVLHWIVWNIPADITFLPEGASATTPSGIRQGRHAQGETGYLGMRPPAGDDAHHYHFQIFALDRMLDVPAGADGDAVVRAARGHAIASGEIVGTFEAKTATH